MRTRLRCLALTSFVAVLAAVCTPACSPDEDVDVGGGSSALVGSACPVGGSLSQGYHWGHDGVDLAAPIGKPIFAVGPGVVTASGPAQGYGQWIRIRHDDGSMTEYGHMSRRDVKVGQRVNPGQRIALVGSEGQSTGPHLHLRVYAHAGDGHGIDPKPYLKARGISLPCAGGAGSGGGGNDGIQCEGGKGTVLGKIAEKYLALGGCSSFLGLPTSDELAAMETGRISKFEHGSIYWNDIDGAHEVHGEIHDLWQSLGGEAGILGYPITDERATPKTKGSYNFFQKGAIYWSPAHRAHAVRGAILDKWKEFGWESGPLGFPTKDEQTVDQGRMNEFEHGSITWNTVTNEVSVAMNP